MNFTIGSPLPSSHSSLHVDFFTLPLLQWLLGFAVTIGAMLVGRRVPFFKGVLARNSSSSERTPSSPKSPTGNKEQLDYTKNFPPSRRHVLPELPETVQGTGKEILASATPTVDLSTQNILPIDERYDEAKGVKYTPTGFSTTEIKAMGDFPAYDILSGVPLPKPYKDFDPKRALMRPYRPFRWNYHQTMSLKKMEPDWWLEVDNQYVERVQQRRDLYAKHGSTLLQSLPGSELACKELMEMCLQFYCARYPAHFSLSPDKRTFHNGLLNEDTDLTTTPPLEVLMYNVPEDFAMVMRNSNDGIYYFRAGAICSSLGWNVSTKIGMDLQGIHNQTVPDYKQKMAFSMDRYFSRKPTDASIQRGSWGLEAGTPLFMPPGDPQEELRELQSPDLTLDNCNLRVDWQTLRRLPLSGAVVFNFTGLFTPVTEFRDEPYVPALLLKILRDGKRSLMDYKGTWHVEHVVVPALESWAREQVERGWVPEDWEEGTLNEDPYYPRWEEKWHRQQGF